MPDARFECDSFSIFGDMYVRKISPEEGKESLNSDIYQQFSRRGIFFHFQNFLDVLMRKERQQPP